MVEFLVYFNKDSERMADRIQDLRKTLINKIDGVETPYCESEEEFYFGAGQLTYYLLNQSASHRKTIVP